MNGRLPWIKWYARDALGDPNLRACKPASRGIWYDMLWLMDASPRRGYLSRDGQTQYADDAICRVLAVSPDELAAARADLLANHVPSVEQPSGIWFNRRMVQDNGKRVKCSVAGRIGGGSPALTTGRLGPPAPPSDSPIQEESICQKPEARTPIKVPYKGDLYRSEDGHAHTTDFEGWSLEQVIEHAAHPTVALPERYARQYFDLRAARGWVDATGLPVARTVGALLADMRKWKSNQQERANPPAEVNRAREWDRAHGAIYSDLLNVMLADGDVARVLSVCRDKWRDVPRDGSGRHVVDVAYEAAKRQRAGR